VGRQRSEIFSFSWTSPELLPRILINNHEVLVENLIRFFLPVGREKRDDCRPIMIFNVKGFFKVIVIISWPPLFFLFKSHIEVIRLQLVERNEALSIVCKELLLVLIVPLFLKDALGDRLFFVVNDRCVALVNVNRHVDVALIS